MPVTGPVDRLRALANRADSLARTTLGMFHNGSATGGPPRSMNLRESRSTVSWLGPGRDGSEPGPTDPARSEELAPAPLVREGKMVRLRRHGPENREAFQRWYADPEIANLLRHDLRPLNERQSRAYFDSIILPLSAAGLCFAIHDRANDLLIGTTALTETDDHVAGARLFRIVIGEKLYWDRGFGTEATRLVIEEAFETLGLQEVRLEVFAHNPRAIAVYERVGFRRTGEHFEYLGPDRPQLHVFEMSIRRPGSDDATTQPAGDPGEASPAAPDTDDGAGQTLLSV
jgi:RimJ/RimL family protein N-acetyltransferase